MLTCLSSFMFFSCAPSVKIPVDQPCRDCHSRLSPGHASHFSLPVRVGEYGSDYSLRNTSGYAFNCGACHPSDLSKHGDGNVDIEMSGDSSSKGLKKWTKNGAYNAAKRTCSNTYCHYLKQTPPWGEKFEEGKRCQSCHDSPPMNDAHFNAKQGTGHMLGIHWDSTGGHGKGTGSEFMIGCNTCHFGVTAKEDTTFVHYTKDGKKGVFTCDRCHIPESGTIKDYSLHVNGRNDIIFSPHRVRSKAQLVNEIKGWKRVMQKGASGAYDEAVIPLNQAAYSRDTKTCSSVSCHLGIPVRWDEQVNCASCHKGF